MITLHGKTPTKSPTDDTKYVWNGGWDPKIEDVTGAKTYTATFTPSEYKITFVDANGDPITEDWYPAGETSAQPPEDQNPEKPDDPDKHYEFDGWNPEVHPVDGPETYEPVYKELFPIKWVDGDGKELKTDWLPNGTMPSYTGKTPTKSPTEDTKYVWNNRWAPTVKRVNGPATYTAQFEPSEYKITFVDADGDPIKEDWVPVGDMPTPPPEDENPEKPDDLDKHYEFDKWDPVIHEVDGPETYEPVYKELFPIKWVDGDDKELKTDWLAKGVLPKYTGADPTKTPTDDTTYVWDKSVNNGWDHKVVKVTGPDTYQAVFKDDKYKITFLSSDADDAAPLTEEWLPAGAMPQEPTDKQPTKANPEPGKKYDPTGWTPEITPVDGPATYKLTFEVPKYPITWKDDKGNVIDTTEVPHGDLPTHADPTKPADEQNDHPFTGWTPEIVPATGPAEYTATFGDDTRKYTVTWLMDDDTLIDRQEYEYGAFPAHADPTKEGDAEHSYTFTGWEPALVEVTKDATYKATFTPSENVYEITWKNDDGTELSKTHVPYGDTPVYDKETPTKEPTVDKEYTFKDWTPEVEPVTGDKTYTATYDEKPREYPITWNKDNGEPDEVTNVPYGEVPTPPANPTKTGPDKIYTFDKWDPDPNQPVDGPKTYTAKYNEVPRKYTVTWLNDDDSLIEKTEVPYGETPKHDAPSKTNPDSDKTYTFNGWTPSPVPVVEDATYKADFTARNKSSGGGGGGGGTPVYTITWVVDGAKTTTRVPRGETPVYPNGTPTKENANFIKWSPDIVPATKNTTYTAEFTEGRPHTTPEESGVNDWLETGEHLIYYRGYPDGSIKPYGNISRAETAMILYRLLVDKNVPVTASFTDVSGTEWYGPAVLTLGSLGVITGYPDETFRPDDPITRMEFTAMCARFADAKPGTYYFSDVPSTHWACKEIMTAAYYGWIEGYSDGTFRPANYIARCEAATVVNRMLDRAADKEYVDAHESELIPFTDLDKAWYYYEMVEGTNAHDYKRVNGEEQWTKMFNNPGV